jgi:hypothetical protein
MSWADEGPVVTVVVRCDLVVRGPDVAPVWPHGHELERRVGALGSSGMLRGWPSSAHLPTAAVVRGGPLGPMLRVRGGHGRRGQLGSAWRQWSPARPEGEARPG